MTGFHALDSGRILVSQDTAIYDIGDFLKQKYSPNSFVDLCSWIKLLMKRRFLKIWKLSEPTRTAKLTITVNKKIVSTNVRDFFIAYGKGQLQLFDVHY